MIQLLCNMNNISPNEEIRNLIILLDILYHPSPPPHPPSLEGPKHYKSTWFCLQVEEVEETKGSSFGCPYEITSLYHYPSLPCFLRMKTDAVSEKLWCKGKIHKDISSTLVTLTE